MVKDRRAEDLLGRVLLDKYHLRAYTHHDQDAEYYRADQIPTGQSVTVKLGRVEWANNAVTRRRFLAEAEMALALRHPRIVTSRDVGMIDRRPFLVFEQLDGRSLAERVAAGPIPVEQSLVIARDVAQALSYAHSRGITHGDVTAANVYVTAEGRAKLTGFTATRAAGEFLLADDQATRLDHASELPEGGAGAGQPATPRDDVRGVGSLLHYALTGRPLRPEAGLDAWSSDLPPLLAPIVGRALGGTPPYSSAATLFGALVEAHAAVVGRADPGWLDIKPTSDPAFPSWRRRSRRRVVAAIAIPLLSVALLTGGLIATSELSIVAASRLMAQGPAKVATPMMTPDTTHETPTK